MNEETRLVSDWLEKQHTNSYCQNLEEFRGLVIEGVMDCCLDFCQAGLIMIGLEKVDWVLLHGKEYQRYKLDKAEAAKNRKEQEKLGDIPF